MWELTASAKTGNWYEGLDKVRELYDVTVGVIGAGKAGSHYIRLLKNFDVRILVSDPTMTPEQADSWGVTLVGLDDLMGHSDVVSIHAPLLPETRKMINRERLGLMKDRAILINTARGALIDEEALADELRTGRISACLDVTDPEPPAPDHPFLHLPNCILTPHIAGAVNNGAKRMAAFAIEEVKRFTAGQKMEGEVDPSSLNSLA
jgi:phosphoglycerate dehydrogenase-like enzyme